MRRVSAAVLVVLSAVAVPALRAGPARAATACPRNTSTDIYANPVVDRPAGVHPTGVRKPRYCSFPTITRAIASVNKRNLASARIIAAGAGSKPAVFGSETFPLRLPANVVLTTVQDPDLGGSGFDPAKYVVRFTGDAANAVVVKDADTIRGLTLKSARKTQADNMVRCAAKSEQLDDVVLDGLSKKGRRVGTGLLLAGGCDMAAAGEYLGPYVRVRRFKGRGVAVDSGATLTLDFAKVYANGGDGLIVHGTATVENAEIAFNADDGVFVDGSPNATFLYDNVRDNGASGFEVHPSTASFNGNLIHDNGRASATVWVAPQMLFVGPPLSGVQVFNPNLNANVTAYPVRGTSCISTDTNSIYSYHRTGSENEDLRVGVTVQDGAAVTVANDHFMTTQFQEGLDWAAVGINSFATTEGTSCSPAPIATDSYPPPPVQ